MTMRKVHKMLWYNWHDCVVNELGPNALLQVILNTSLEVCASVAALQAC